MWLFQHGDELRGLRHEVPTGGVQERVTVAFDRETGGYFGTLLGVRGRARGAYLEPVGKMGEAAPNGSGAERLECEADPRHAGLIVYQLGPQWFVQGSVHARGKGASQASTFGHLQVVLNMFFIGQRWCDWCSALALDRPGNSCPRSSRAECRDVQLGIWRVSSAQCVIWSGVCGLVAWSSYGSLKSRSTWWYSLTATTPVV